MTIFYYCITDIFILQQKSFFSVKYPGFSLFHRAIVEKNHLLKVRINLFCFMIKK